MSQVFDCTNPESRTAGIQAAVSAVRSGQLVVFPTDTVYGVGADAFRADSVKSLLSAKGRSAGMPASVLVGSWHTLDGLVLSVPKVARQLTEAFWPGALSIVLPHAPSLAWDLGDTRGTVMLRMPLHPVAIELLREVGPMAQSSANLTGHTAAISAAEAQSQLGESVAVYLEAGSVGDSVPSTIADLTGAKVRLLREGAISAAEISAVIGYEVELAQ